MLRSTVSLRGLAVTRAALAGLCAFATFVLTPVAASAAVAGSGTRLMNEGVGVQRGYEHNQYAPGETAAYGYAAANTGDRTVRQLRIADASVVKGTLPATGVRVEDAMEAGGVLLAVGTTLLLIRRKRRELR